MSIGELTTEVIADSDTAASAAAAAVPDPPKDATAVRAELAAMARAAMRTRAEGFDD